MKGWYFSNSDCRLGHDDGRLIRPGVTHTHEGDIELCASGLHFSRNILHALHYAPGPYVWRIDCGGTMLHSADKSVCTERHYLWGYDASDVLRRFARYCALDVIHLWDAPPVVVEYLTTGEEKKRDAATLAAADAATWAVAMDAARAAARDAATWAVAMDAAWAKAMDAAMDAAKDAARDAAMAAAWAAEMAAAREKQARRLTSMIVRNRPTEAICLTNRNSVV